MKQVWPDVTVVESGRTRNVSPLRKVIEADPPRRRNAAVIETAVRAGDRPAALAGLTAFVNAVQNGAAHHPKALVTPVGGSY